ncbi:toll/interleukin-1 receptor domain-containing protein [Methylocystis sp.]|uniref:toll/interleukin-1 receptor domain-containing protein n=1 Tax=Methylocystis sp. TaxID=1911079 RepID=UPI0025EF5348|nr:toll/interleukin-1 receptor domain-containing protein [Methylocystis sp.]
MRFFWRDVEGLSVENRFSDNALGYPAWRALVERLYNVPPDAPSDSWASLFDSFIGDISREFGPGSSSRAKTCCLFISHRMSDVNNALHIAWLATQVGYDYWLDIHNPTLIAASGSSLPSPAKDILLAAIIEIALLNATHVIALHTKHSLGSKWIPYELGRAKARLVQSDQAAGWFDRHTPPSTCGEYVYLARQLGPLDIQNWLTSTNQYRCSPTATKNWPYGDHPPPLDP